MGGSGTSGHSLAQKAGESPWTVARREVVARLLASAAVSESSTSADKETEGAGGLRQLRGRALVEVFAGRWLSGRMLLPGTLVALPVCGLTCEFITVAGHERVITAAAGAHSAQRAGAVAFLVDGQTAVTLLPGLPESLSAGSDSDITAAGSSPSASAQPHPPASQALSSSAAGEGGGGDTSSHTSARQLALRVASDLRGVSFGSVGGLEGPKAALKEAVLLPLRHPELFTRWRGERGGWETEHEQQDGRT